MYYSVKFQEKTDAKGDLYHIPASNVSVFSMCLKYIVDDKVHMVHIDFVDDKARILMGISGV